jgi:hypothetical protein
MLANQSLQARPLAPDDPEARRLYGNVVTHSWRGLTEGDLRVVRRRDGGTDFVADRMEKLSPADVERRLADQGCRLLRPTTGSTSAAPLPGL